MRQFSGMVAIIVLFLSAVALLRHQLECDMVVDRKSDRLITHLPNGLIVVAQRIPTAPVVSVQCWVKTGSIYEQQHNGAGLSHFLEHLIAGGSTTTRTEEQSGRILGQIGAQINAATSLDNVHYYINTASAHAATAIELLSDWMLNSTITQAEYQRERDVIQREFEMGQGDPGRIFWKLTQQTRYDAHPARHPTIGYLDEFLKVTRDEIYAFYKLMYVPNNMVFVVSGDIDPQQATAQIHSLWKDAQPGRLPELSFPIEPVIDQPREASAQADIQLPRLRLAWPGTRAGAPHDYALDLLASILGDGELSRLVKSVRNEAQLVTQIDAYNASFFWGEGFFGVDATTTPDKLDAARDAVLAQIRLIKEQGVSAEELNRAKAKTLAALVFAAQTAEGTASRLASDLINTGNPDYLAHYAREIQKITQADLAAAAQAILLDQRLMTLTLLPRSGKIAELARPADGRSMNQFEKVNLDNARLLERLKQAVKSDEGDQAEQARSPMEMFRLDNGLRVLIERDSRLPIVSMQWYHLGGQLLDEAGHEGLANAAASMMIKGAGGLSADEIDKRLENRGARLSGSCGSNTLFISGQCLSSDFVPVLELMADVVIRPDFPEDQWALLKPRLLAAIRTSRDRWSSEMVEEFDSRYFALHPWAVPVLGRLEAVESLSAEDLRAFHESHITAVNSVLCIVGDVDPQEARAEVQRLFGGLKAGSPVESWPTPGERSTGLVQVTTGKPLCAVQIGYGPGVARDSEDFAAMQVMTRIVSSFPTGWIHKALRGDGPGLVYAAWGYNRSGVVPGYWAMAFNTQPASADEAINRCLAITARLKDELVDADELARARSAVMVSEAMEAQSCSQRASRAALDELYGVGFAGSQEFLRRIDAVDAKEIQRIARTYLQEPLIVVLTHQPIDESGIELK